MNKFIAHAATPESRNAFNADEIKITLGKLFSAHRIICETAQFIGSTLLYQNLGNFLAVPQYDQLKHFEKPWIREDALQKLDTFWNQYDKETCNWLHWDWQKEFDEYANA